MKRKVKYKNFDRILTVALLGDYSQNVPKPKRTQVKMYLRGDKIYSSEIKTYPSGVKTKRGSRYLSQGEGVPP